MSFKQVDISSKPVSWREAEAVGTIRLKPSTLQRIKRGRVEKGDPLSLARLAGIAAAKRTPDVVILCHALRLEATEVRARVLGDGVEVTAKVVASAKTGVEMEALTAVTVALLNVWDMVKQYEKDAGGQYPSTRIEGVRVKRKVKEPIETA